MICVLFTLLDTAKRAGRQTEPGRHRQELGGRALPIGLPQTMRTAMVKARAKQQSDALLSGLHWKACDRPPALDALGGLQHVQGFPALSYMPITKHDFS